MCCPKYKRQKKTTHKIHRLVAQHFIPNPNNKTTVDHIDSKATLNNTVSNLRWATRQEQRRNTSKQKASASSQYKGVSWNKDKNKWQSYIKFNGKQNTLGYFKTEEEAALAYNLKATEHFGEFKKLNVLSSIEH
jgi:chemotaxis response regulator CheB